MATTQLITTRQAAERLAVDVSTVYRFAERGLLEPALRLDNRQMLFDPAAVEALRKERAEHQGRCRLCGRAL
jgi:excisionase family DNA binding protein